MAANKKKERTLKVQLVADSVTKNTVIFAECTATGAKKELKESLIGRVYVKQASAPGFKEQGIALSEPDENGDQFLDFSKMDLTITLKE